MIDLLDDTSPPPQQQQVSSLGLIQQHQQQLMQRQQQTHQQMQHQRPMTSPSRSTQGGPNRSSSGSAAAVSIDLLDSDEEEQSNAPYNPFAPVGGGGGGGGGGGNNTASPVVSAASSVADKVSPQRAFIRQRTTSADGVVTQLAFTKAKEDSFYPLGHLSAKDSATSGGGRGWSASDLPQKITVLDKSVEPWFGALEQLPYLELALPPSCAPDSKPALAVKKFIARVLNGSRRKVAIMSVDWLRDTHPTTMGSSNLTGHLYLTPPPGDEGETLLRIYYAAVGAPHRF